MFCMKWKFLLASWPATCWISSGRCHTRLKTGKQWWLHIFFCFFFNWSDFISTFGWVTKLTVNLGPQGRSFRNLDMSWKHSFSNLLLWPTKHGWWRVLKAFIHIMMHVTYREVKYLLFGKKIMTVIKICCLLDFKWLVPYCRWTFNSKELVCWISWYSPQSKQSSKWPNESV